MQEEQEPTVGIDNAASSDTKRRAGLLLSQLGRSTDLVNDPMEWLTTDASRPILMSIPQRTSQTVAAAHSAAPGARIIGLCWHRNSASSTREYVRAGLAGVIAVSEPEGILMGELAAMLAGYIVVRSRALPCATDRDDKASGSLRLSRRDRQLLSLIAKGASREHIASALGYSQRHLRRITAELVDTMGAATRAHAAALAVELGLVSDIHC